VISGEKSMGKLPPSTDTPLRHSLIVPAYNEADTLPRLLDSVDDARARYARGANAVEVVVADNVSTDATARVSMERGCRVVRVEKRIIGAARNGGARASRGAVLSFVDADSRIHPETFNAIDAALSSERIVGGATGVRMERMSPGIAATYLLFLPLVWTTGFDTGVVFCRREDFLEAGGYGEDRLFAEDVLFLLKLRRLGRARGQGLTRLTRFKAVTSARKFDRHGDWHYFTFTLRGLWWSLFSPARADRLARSYWYERDC
jgi:glycosyltransferase involved in cell wall biosynthesis